MLAEATIAGCTGVNDLLLRLEAKARNGSDKRYAIADRFLACAISATRAGSIGRSYIAVPRSTTPAM